ncbi:MAG: Wzz/FepE/Etk N-terminal domain-containing protein [Elusimicrobiota bacterium]|nr:Wzz/FepE/Etk N-terminal domain-containing protein [Elusimicrobiota bacterium]
MTQDDRMDDEIDLGQIFLVLWKRKELIAFFTGALLIVGMAAAFLQPGVYESSSMIMIIPSRTEFIKNPLNASLSLDLGGKNKMKGSISIIDHLSLLTSGDVAENIAAELSTPEDKIKNGVVAEMLHPERVKGSSMIKLAVKGRDPALCARVADVWAKVYLNKVIAMVSSETAASQSFLYGELKKAEKEMSSEEQALFSFNIKNNVEMKTNELAVKRAKLQNIQSAAINNAKTLEIKRIRLAALKAEIKKHGQYKREAKVITDDVLWSKILDGKNVNSLKGQKIYSEEINSVYSKLESQISGISVDVAFLSQELNYLKKEKEKLQKEVKKLSIEVSALKIKRDEHTRTQNIAQTRYRSIFSRITEATIASSAKLGDVKIISKAIVPVSPVSPNKKKIAAVALAGGLFAGVMAAFFATFIEKQQKGIL